MFCQDVEFNVHFIGVGGVSIGWLAEYFQSVGFCVSGSDKNSSARTEKLEQKGIKVFIGHSESNLQGAQVVVYSDAIDEDNVELKAARQSGAYLMTRSQALSSVAENFCDVVGVSGCHGKTTVSCMLAHIFKCAGLKFTAHIGGEDSVLGDFISYGSDVFLSEVCEFRGNINRFNADYAVCLSTDKDHLDCYGDENELRLAYLNFIKRAYKSIINKKDGYLANIKTEGAVGFSIGEGGDFTAKNLQSDGGRYSFDLYKGEECKGRIALSVFGCHNVENALAAAACAIQMGIEFRYIKKGLKSFKGVVRRFEKIAKLSGADVIADYAHHPSEISACLKTAREVARGEVFVIFQPHTYSRTVYLKNEFLEVLSKIENLSLFKTFPARESYKKGGSAFDLHLLLDGSSYFEDEEALIEYYRKKLKRKDILLVMGAGDLYYAFKSRFAKKIREVK